LGYPLFRVGEGVLTVGAVATVLLNFITLYLVSLWVKRLITRRLLTRTSLDLGAREAIGSLFRHFVLFLGSIVIIQSAGIDLTALNVLAGAIGVGIGFGLQNIANNFISGIIILLFCWSVPSRSATAWRWATSTGRWSRLAHAPQRSSRTTTSP
jgi:small-conductance mechanosensitive channel